MARILNIETATSLCSVATAQEGQVVSVVETPTENDHAKLLTKNIDLVLAQSGWGYADIDAIAVSEGPGSYTGLRIGIATAKGLCFALQVPLLGVPTLKSMAFRLQQFGLGTYLPILSSRKGEVYLAVYDEKLITILSPQALELTDKIWEKGWENQLVITGGPGSKSFWDHNNNYQHTLIDQSIVSSSNMASLSYQSYQFKEEKSLIYFEPLYLKPVYISTKNK